MSDNIYMVREIHQNNQKLYKFAQIIKVSLRKYHWHAIWSNTIKILDSIAIQTLEFVHHRHLKTTHYAVLKR